MMTYLYGGVLKLISEKRNGFIHCVKLIYCILRCFKGIKVMFIQGFFISLAALLHQALLLG